MFLSKEYSNLVNRYSQFLLSWGQIEKAIKLLHDHFQLYTESENYSERKEVIQNLKEVERLKQKFQNNAWKKIENLEFYLTQDEEKELNELLNEKKYF